MRSRSQAVFFNRFSSTPTAANPFAARTVGLIDLAVTTQDGRPAHSGDPRHLLDATPAMLCGDEPNQAAPTSLVHGRDDAIDAAVQFRDRASGMAAAIGTRAKVQWFFIQLGHRLIL